jgi:hypothetical protein
VAAVGVGATAADVAAVPVGIAADVAAVVGVGPAPAAVAADSVEVVADA